MTHPDPDRHDGIPDDDPHPGDHEPRRERDEDSGGQVSEGGSGGLSRETAEGGADAVPDTPDVNNPGRPLPPQP